MGKKVKILENQSDFSVFDDFAAVWCLQTSGTAKQCRLTRAGGTDNTKNLALVYFQGNVTENVQGSETFLYVFHFK